MIRILLAIVAVLCVAGTSQAQHCRTVQYHAPQPTYYSAPTYAAPTYYQAPTYVAPVQNVTYVITPAAVYTLPGAPTVQINVYPANQTYVQPVLAPAATLTPDQAAKAQIIPIQIPEGSEVKVIQVPVPIAPSK